MPSKSFNSFFCSVFCNKEKEREKRALLYVTDWYVEFNGRAYSDSTAVELCTGVSFERRFL